LICTKSIGFSDLSPYCTFLYQQCLWTTKEKYSSCWNYSHFGIDTCQKSFLSHQTKMIIQVLALSNQPYANAIWSLSIKSNSRHFSHWWNLKGEATNNNVL
jgi:hypothetical protein